MSRVRETSRVAFQKLVQSGNLPKAQIRVLEFLFDSGPLTGTELDFQMSYPSAHKRLSELRDAGLVVELDEKKCCTITGETVTAWDVK